MTWPTIATVAIFAVSGTVSYTLHVRRQRRWQRQIAEFAAKKHHKRTEG